ncbi:MAG: c-type cytochrome [Chitinophagales bacterium]
MKKVYLLPLFASILLMFSCGGDAPAPEKKAPVVEEVEEPEIEEEEEEFVEEEEVSEFTNVGVGPVTELIFDEEIDEEMAANGKELYKSKGCIACHHATMKVIGPAQKGVFDRRNPAWVMNMIINPEKMLAEDPDAIALLEEYNGVVMTNQEVSEEEARAMVEYFRTL